MAYRSDETGAKPGRAGRLPAVGFSSILLILMASYSVHANWISADTVSFIRWAVETFHLITAFICVLIIGSILSLDLLPLTRSLPKLLFVIVISSLIAVPAGTFIGILSGVDGSKALFLLVIPVLSGGLNAGVLPLALGYGSAFGTSDEIFATLLPPVLLGNFAAIIVAGLLGHLTPRRGTGLHFVGKAETQMHPRADATGIVIALALLLIATFAAYWLRQVSGISEPMSLLALSGILLACNVLTPRIRLAIVAVYRFCSRLFIVPVLVIVGLLYSPWAVLLAGFTLTNLAVVMTIVMSLSMAGHFLSRLLGVSAIDGAIIAVSRAAMGGSGNIAMLTAAQRLDLMPFAQIATRLGGAVTVLLALLAL